MSKNPLVDWLFGQYKLSARFVQPAVPNLNMIKNILKDQSKPWHTFKHEKWLSK